MLMKSTLWFVAASACSVLLISTANAGGHRHDLSSSAKSAGGPGLTTLSDQVSAREHVSVVREKQRPSRSDRSGGVVASPTNVGTSITSMTSAPTTQSNSLLFKSTNPNYIMGAFNTSILDTGVSSSQTTSTASSSSSAASLPSKVISSSIQTGSGLQASSTLDHGTISVNSQKSSSMMQSSSSSTTK